MRPRRVPQGRPRLVLAVDDEEDHLLAYETVFGKERDLRLVTVTSTGGAEAALAAHGADAVLLDLAVPDAGGLALCRWIRSRPRFRGVPVIALSAYPAALFAGPALAAGCTSFLQKPHSLAGIVAEVRRHLAAAAVAARDRS